MNNKIPAFVLCLVAPTAFAHSGHHQGSLLAILWHMFSQPSHWGLLLCLLLPLALLLALRKSARSKVRARRTDK